MPVRYRCARLASFKRSFFLRTFRYFNEKQLGRGRACELVTGALRQFPGDQDVQIEACGAVANLANNSKSNRVKLGK